MSDAWLTGRARELLAQIQVSPPERQPSYIPRFDELLIEGRNRDEPWMLGKLLRFSAIARLTTPSTAAIADPMIDELLTHSRRNGLLVLQAGAHALRGLRALLASAEDTALTEVAQALAMLDERPEPDVLVDKRDWYRSLSATLVDIALVLTRLGMYEDAEPVLSRANRAIAHGGGPHEIVVQLVNQVKLLLSWGLHLERIGDELGAAERFAAAAAVVATVERPYAESLFTRDAGRSAVAQVPELAAAVALARPDGAYVENLSAMLTQAAEPSYLIVMTVALARCLECEGREREALSVLIDTRDRLADDRTERTLRLALSREYARLCGPEASDQTTNALELYV
ncbi:MAG: GGDEF domain-containing protein, partial [Sciscionella sp.]